MDHSTGTDPEQGAHTGRRGVLRAAGALGVTAVGGAALAACGTGSATGSDEGAGGAGQGSAGTAGGGIPLADVPVGGGTVVAAEKVVVTQPVEGTFKAFDSTCPHQGCAVAMVTDDGIVCPCHGSVFDASTGERRSGPAQAGLTPRTVAVNGEHLIVS